MHHARSAAINPGAEVCQGDCARIDSLGASNTPTLKIRTLKVSFKPAALARTTGTVHVAKQDVLRAELVVCEPGVVSAAGEKFPNSLLSLME
ncbi:MAG: hypothetical protein ABI328_12860 [Gemmatimonadaceae bacterium]